MHNKKMTSIIQIEESKPPDRCIGEEGHMVFINALR